MISILPNVEARQLQWNLSMTGGTGRGGMEIGPFGMAVSLSHRIHGTGIFTYIYH